MKGSKGTKYQNKGGAGKNQSEETGSTYSRKITFKKASQVPGENWILAEDCKNRRKPKPLKSGAILIENTEEVS